MRVAGGGFHWEFVTRSEVCCCSMVQAGSWAIAGTIRGWFDNSPELGETGVDDAGRLTARVHLDSLYYGGRWIVGDREDVHDRCQNEFRVVRYVAGQYRSLLCVCLSSDWKSASQEGI